MLGKHSDEEVFEICVVAAGFIELFDDVLDVVPLILLVFNFIFGLQLIHGVDRVQAQSINILVERSYLRESSLLVR